MVDRCRVVLGLAVAGVLLASVANAGLSPFGGGATGVSPMGYAPRVPVSALARPAAWFDPSRLQIATSVSVGSGWGRSTEALQLTRLSYRFAAPVWMNVSVGNAWGPSRAGSGSGFFLEGIEVGARPFPNLQVQFQYRDIRSALQIPHDYRGFGWGD